MRRLQNAVLEDGVRFAKRLGHHVEEAAPEYEIEGAGCGLAADCGLRGLRRGQAGVCPDRGRCDRPCWSRLIAAGSRKRRPATAPDYGPPRCRSCTAWGRRMGRIFRQIRCAAFAGHRRTGAGAWVSCRGRARALMVSTSASGNTRRSLASLMHPAGRPFRCRWVSLPGACRSAYNSVPISDRIF